MAGASLGVRSHQVKFRCSQQAPLLIEIKAEKLESLIHKVFAAAQLDLTIPDRLGHMVKPREWFVVALQVINEAVERIRDRTITEFRYHAVEGRLIRA